jgi:EF-hand domain pair
MSISFSTFPVLHRAFSPTISPNVAKANSGTATASADTGPTREPSTTVTLSKDALALVSLASRGVTVTEISGPGLSQLVKTGQTPLLNSPGMHGGTVSQQDFEQLVLQAGGTKQQAGQLFSAFDSDGNGFLSPAEILSGLSKAGDGSPFAQTLLSVMDKSHDGSVSSMEFLQFETNLVSAENPSNVS